MRTKCVDFPKPEWVEQQVWINWLRKVREGDALPNMKSLGAYAQHYKKRTPWNKPEPPRRRHVISAKLLGRKEFRAFVARIEAGRCDPRFVVGVDAIMWDTTRLAPTGAGILRDAERVLEKS